MLPRHVERAYHSGRSVSLSRSPSSCFLPPSVAASFVSRHLCLKGCLEPPGTRDSEHFIHILPHHSFQGPTLSYYSNKQTNKGILNKTLKPVDLSFFDLYNVSTAAPGVYLVSNCSSKICRWAQAATTFPADAPPP